MNDSQDIERTRRPSSANRTIASWIPIAISVLSLVVATVGTVTAHRQADTATRQAETAEKAYKNSLRQQQKTSAAEEMALALKVSTKSDTDSFTVTNGGTLPIRWVHIFLTDFSGRPAAEYNLLTSLAGCTAITFTSKDDRIPDQLLVSFEDVNGREWFAEPFGGIGKATDVSGLATDTRYWDEKLSKVSACS